MTDESVVSPDEQVTPAAAYEDYWGADEQTEHFLPDGKQYFLIQVMNEGQRTKYQKDNNSSMKVDRGGSATINVDPSKERHALIQSAVVGWNIYRNNKKVEFDKNSMLNWLQTAPVKLVDDLEFAIRMANPWLQADMTLEQIDTEIDRLKDMRDEVEKREQGK